MIKYREKLWTLFPNVEEAVCAELGVAEGLFSRDILAWGVKRLYSVDAWKTINQKGDAANDQAWHDANYKNALELFKPYGERSVILRGLSYMMAKQVEDNTLDLLYLDGDHSYEGVIRDLEAWYPKVKSGAIIAGHDFVNKNYGVNRAVKDFASRNNIREIRTIEENKSADAGFFMKKP